MLINFAHYLFGWTLIALSLSWLLSVIYPLFSRALTSLSAAQAAMFTLSYGILAPAAASLALIVLSLPTLAFPFVADHCHGNICAPHILHINTETMQGIVLITLIITALLGVFALMVHQLLKNQRQLQTLNTLSDTASQSYRLIDSQQHIAWCAGLLKPQIYLSRGLVESLSPQQLQVIIAHEQMHVMRRDNLRKWVLYWSTIAWPKTQRQVIRQHLSNYSETICDLAAAHANQQTTNSNTLIDALIHCHSTENIQATLDAEKRLQQRIKNFKHELNLQVEKTKTHSALLKPSLLIIGIWFSTIILAIRFGHPLLEWLIS